MMNALQKELLASLTATLSRQPPGDYKTTTQELWNLLTMLIEELAESAYASPATARLDWHFGVDSTNTHSYLVEHVTSGTYLLASQTNCVSIEITVNGQPVQLPFKARAGERIALTIVRGTPDAAAVQVISVGAYRQLTAGAR